MTRLKFLSFFALSLVAICFCFYQISKINIQQSMEETQLRLVQGQKVLQSIEAVEARLNLAALSAAMRDSQALASLDAMLVAQADAALPSSGEKFRQAIAAAFAATAFEVLSAQDLVFVQIGDAQQVIGTDEAGTRLLKADADRVDLAAALDLAGHYVQFESQLYRLNALRIARPAALGEKAPQAIAPQAALTEGGAAREIPVIVAIARHKDVASIQRLSSLIGVGMTIVAGELVIAAPQPQDDLQEAGVRLSKVAALRTSGPLAIKSLASLAPVPLALPLFVENPASHQAQVLPLPGIDAGRIVLDTQMDGLLMLAFVQKNFLLGLLVFLAVGILFALSLGGEESPVGRTQATRVRKVPIAGQSLSKAPFTRTSASGAALPSEGRDAKAASRELALLDAPRAEDQVPKMLTPDEFNFGNSPLAEELSPQPSPLPQDAVAPAPAEFIAEQAEQGDPFAVEAQQVAAEDFASDVAGYQYSDQAVEPMGQLGVDQMFAYAGGAYPVQDATQVYEGKTPVPGLYGAAEGYQPAVTAGPESLEAFYDDAAGFEREATRQMSLEAINALNALQAGAAGTAPIWDPSSGNAAADYGDGHGAYGADLGQPACQPAYPDQGQELDEAQFREIYEQFLTLRAQCGEPPTALTYEGFVHKLRMNREQLMQKYNCASVRFQVYVKEGKAALKATPIRS